MKMNDGLFVQMARSTIFYVCLLFRRQDNTLKMRHKFLLESPFLEMMSMVSRKI